MNSNNTETKPLGPLVIRYEPRLGVIYQIPKKTIIELSATHHARKIKIIQIPNKYDLDKITQFIIEIGGSDVYEISFSLLCKLANITVVDNMYNIYIEDVMNDFLQNI